MIKILTKIKPFNLVISIFLFIWICLWAIYIPAIAFAQADLTKAQVDTSSNELNQKVADGESLNISVKLANFGKENRVDVHIEYLILDSKEEEIYSTTDTVAVETTASFIKKVQIPAGTLPGIYIARTSIIYQGQLVPALSEFHFTVEKRILGLYQSDFILWGSVTLVIGILLMLFGRILVKRTREMRIITFDYSDKPRDERIFYEIISDTIMQMRQRAGDDALNIALNIDGLDIDERSGRVISLTEQPSRITANLVSEYEKLLGRKVSFSFRKENTK